MRVRDLGSLAVVNDDGERPVAGVRATAMLALLTINANRRVSVDALMDAAWGERISAGASSSLESHVLRLRGLLEPGRAPRQAPTVLVSDAGGYRLVVGSQDVDSLLFDELADHVGDLLAAGDGTAALARADAALALWRGRPYGALGERDWARPAVARLEEMHGQLRERRVEALLATGEPGRALSDLEPLVAAMPYRESLRALQMLSLHRCGRADEALQTYQRVRRTLVEEVGTEPGTELQALHRRILDDDAGLAGPARAVEWRDGPGARAVEVHLPVALTPLLGRDDTRRRIGGLLGDHRLVTVAGPAGCGKTRLAVEVARAEATAFPDGVWFVDLTAVSDPDLVVDVTVSTIGFAPSATAAPMEDLRGYLASRRILIVLDNCEHVAAGVAQVVEAVLGDHAECTFLATSREPVGLDGETIWTLEPLGLPSPDTEPFAQAAPAVELFLERLRAAVPTLAVDEQVVDRAVDICVALDGLPLPIELAAARARSFTLDDIAAQVSADPGRLRRVGRAPADHRATVRSAVEWSYRMLTEPEQVAHRRISVLPGQFTRSMAAAAVGDHPAYGGDDDVGDLLAQLVHRSMLASDGARRPEGRTLFRQLATVRAHAAHALTEAGEESAARDRRDAWTTDVLARRPPLGRAEEADWYSRLDDGYATVRATLARHLIEEPSAVGGRLAHRLGFYWYYRAGLVEGTRWLQSGRDALRDDEPADVVLAASGLAAALLVQGRVAQARPHVDDVLELLPRVGADRLVEVGESLVGLSSSAWLPDAIDLVTGIHGRLGPITDRAGDDNLGLLTDAVGCLATVASGRPADAVQEAGRVYDRAVASGNVMASWITAGVHMLVAVLAGRPGDGIPWVNRAIRGHAQLGSGGGGLYIENRANFASMAGDHREAARIYALARTETRRAGMVWPRRPLTQQLLDRTRDHLDPAEFDRAWREGERLTMGEMVVPQAGAGLEPDRRGRGDAS